ncbi:MAG: 30S ribosomal protein S24e [Candidatus Thorarchaeota archaeon]|nr:MAG: 30S ribosomal protein S24e [Candidatus Thorarchaeota archaeon]
MKIDILQERENKPLARKEIDFAVEHLGGTTPSRAEIKSKLVAQFDADPETVVVKKLITRFGSGMSKGQACIYSSKDQMERIELDYVRQRHIVKEKK